MLISRSLIVVACAAGLLALPTAAGAQNGRTATSHVVKTPKGSQLAVPITVRYTLDGKGKSLARSSLTTRVVAAARLPGGRVLRAAETRRVPGKASMLLEHHLFFSVARTRILRKALAKRQKVRLTVASAIRADLDGDGKTDARSTQKRSQALARPRGARAAKPTDALRGTDPCGALSLAAAACRNVPARRWRATHLWDVGAFTVTCPGAFPVASDTARYRTSSRRFTATVLTRGRRAQLTVIDDNVRGHAITYAPTVACTTR